jgi:8-oxo-dGTP pyrophosphatase MutT (NUDIX family)
MEFRQFILAFREILSAHPLPGPDAHLLMASDYYRNKRIDINKVSGYKKSAVCLLLYEKEGEIKFILIRRPSTHRHHAGQIALPGGSCDASETFEQTALRELHEEVGIRITDAHILGRLSPLYIPVSNFYIQPVIAWLDHAPAYHFSTEVEEVIEFSLQGLLDDSIISETEVVTGGSLKIKTPYFNVQGHVLWGATAMLLSEVKQILLKNQSSFPLIFG